MSLEPHRLPWALALLGAIHGWVLACATENARYGHPRDVPGRVLLAVTFAAAFSLAGWLHVRKPPHERGGLVSAAARHLGVCVAFGLGPAGVCFYRFFPLAIEGGIRALGVGIVSLPSALLLVHAHSGRAAPRDGSLLAGADRAEEALAVLGAMVLLPWWASSAPPIAALVLVALALSAGAVAAQSMVLAKQVDSIARLFQHPAGGDTGDAAVVCDIGLGYSRREIARPPSSAYRSAARSPALACIGDPDHGRHAALRLAGGALAIGVAAGIQVLWLLR